MSSLAIRAAEIDNHRFGDAIVFQPKSEDCRPHYPAAQGLIRHVIVGDKDHWSFCTLLPIGGVMFTGAVILGNKSEIIKAAEYQCGAETDSNEWIVVKYSDPDFPQNLIPH